jgi:hypothetical protein
MLRDLLNVRWNLLEGWGLEKGDVDRFHWNLSASPFLSFLCPAAASPEYHKVTVHHSADSYKKENSIRKAGRQEKVGGPVPAFLPSLEALVS